ncbi:MAG: PfkB family carbohydrate kinase [bacterium]
MLKKPFVVFGEALWDYFPHGKRLGGAPLNFSYYFLKSGGNPILISALGKDEDGREALENIKGLGLEIKYIQLNKHKTGKVIIKFTEKGHRFYPQKNGAFEFIDYPPDTSIIKESSGIYLGTLARHYKHNKIVCDRLLSSFKGRHVFMDINLRKQFYNYEDVKFLLRQLTSLKLNEQEVRILKKLKIVQDRWHESIIETLIREYDIRQCCITLGAKGAIAGNKEGIVRVKGIPAKKSGDTVGAGDAFSAVWLAELFKGRSLYKAVERANQIGSIVASSSGAIVDLDFSQV